MQLRLYIVGGSTSCVTFLLKASSLILLIMIQSLQLIERGFAKHTLWLCLDIGLRLLHPFMPFITEEMWQRLHLHAAPSSIMVSEYPFMVDCWKNEKVENEMDYPVMFVVTSLHSLEVVNGGKVVCFLM